MAGKVLDTPTELIQELYRVKARNAFDGKHVGDIPEQQIWDVAEVCAYLGLEINFVLKEVE